MLNAWLRHRSASHHSVLCYSFEFVKQRIISFHPHIEFFKTATPTSEETGGGGRLRGSASRSEFDVWRCLQQSAGRCWSTDENCTVIIMRLGWDASDSDRPETPSVKSAKLSAGNWNLPRKLTSLFFLHCFTISFATADVKCNRFEAVQNTRHSQLRHNSSCTELALRFFNAGLVTQWKTFITSCWRSQIMKGTQLNATAVRREEMSFLIISS